MERSLERPSLQLVASFTAMRDAVLATGEDAWVAPGAQIVHSDVVAYIDAVNAWSEGRGVPERWVPSSTYWIVGDGMVVGELNVRHRLTDWLREAGGQIGYLTHPAHRNRGVATFALQHGVRIAAQFGIGEALVTCLESNAPSIRVIEKCGGVRIADASRGAPRRRYVMPAPEAIMPKRGTPEPW